MECNSCIHYKENICVIFNPEHYINDIGNMVCSNYSNIKMIDLLVGRIVIEPQGFAGYPNWRPVGLKEPIDFSIEARNIRTDYKGKK